MTLVPTVITATAVDRPGSFSREDLDTLRRTICHDLNDSEFELFAAICRRTGLDPVAKQIYAVKRYDGRQKREVMQVQTSIDGFRVIAERSGNYAGPAPTFWCGSDGVWRDVWLSPEPPAAAKAGVYRRDFTEPVYAVAKFASYCARNKDGSPQAMWRTMPEVMIAKCAESLAIRRAFPNDVAGVYTREEMAQADHRAAVPTKVVGEVSGVSVPPAAATSPAPSAGRGADAPAEVVPAPASNPAPGGGAGSPDLAAGSKSARASQEQDATPSGPAPTPLKTVNERAYGSLNRKCRAIHAEHGAGDKETAAAQWEALAWACSGGRTVHLGELSPDEASAFRQRMIDVAEGRATWTETDDPAFLGWTLTVKEH